MKRFKTGLVPVNIGIYGGFDYGKVWGGSGVSINPTLRLSEWNTSYGGGFFFTAANMLGANIAVFDSRDGMRIAAGLGFNFLGSANEYRFPPDLSVFSSVINRVKLSLKQRPSFCEL